MLENCKKLKKIAFEIKIVPVKNVEKVCVKATSSCVENIEKKPKKRFTQTLDFQGEKTLPDNLPTSKKSYTYQLFCFHKPTNTKSKKPSN